MVIMEKKVIEKVFNKMKRSTTTKKTLCKKKLSLTKVKSSPSSICVGRFVNI